MQFYSQENMLKKEMLAEHVQLFSQKRSKNEKIHREKDLGSKKKRKENKAEKKKSVSLTSSFISFIY